MIQNLLRLSVAFVYLHVSTVRAEATTNDVEKSNIILHHVAANLNAARSGVEMVRLIGLNLSDGDLQFIRKNFVVPQSTAVHGPQIELRFSDGQRISVKLIDSNTVLIDGKTFAYDFKSPLKENAQRIQRLMQTAKGPSFFPEAHAFGLLAIAAAVVVGLVIIAGLIYVDRYVACDLSEDTGKGVEELRRRTGEEAVRNGYDKEIKGTYDSRMARTRVDILETIREEYSTDGITDPAALEARNKRAKRYADETMANQRKEALMSAGVRVQFGDYASGCLIDAMNSWGIKTKPLELHAYSLKCPNEPPNKNLEVSVLNFNGFTETRKYSIDQGHVSKVTAGPIDGTPPYYLIEFTTPMTRAKAITDLRDHHEIKLNGDANIDEAHQRVAASLAGDFNYFQEVCANPDRLAQFRRSIRNRKDEHNDPGANFSSTKPATEILRTTH